MMSLETLRLAVRRLNYSGALSSNVNFGWHAGEPTVLPPAYFQDAINIIHDELKRDVRFQIQTNGTLLSREWEALISRNNIHVGLSIDGPKEIHDKYRKSRRGGGSFEKVVAALRMLQDIGASYGVICVLSEEGLRTPSLISDFFESMDVKELSINIPEIEGVNTSGMLITSSTIQHFKSFVEHFYSNRNTPGKLKIMQIEAMRNLLLRKSRSPVALAENIPLSILTLSWDGEIVTFSPELLGFQHRKYGSFSIGSIYNDFNFDTGKLKSFYSEIQEGISLCKSNCSYFEICGGGHPASKFFESGSFNCSSHNSCEINIKLLAEVISELVLEEAARETENGLNAERGTQT